ncbi:hypothetical protein ABPG74_007089 [Tetrahymena malaccensis]
MISEEIGKYYSSTQKELVNLKQQLNQLQSNNKFSDQNINGIYGSIQNNVSKINNEIENRLEDLFYKMMNNHNSTVQELKGVEIISQQDPQAGLQNNNEFQTLSSPNLLHQKSHSLLQNNSSERFLLRRENTQSTALLSNKLSQQSLQVGSAVKKESFLPSFIKDHSQGDPRQKPFGKKFYRAKYISQKNLEKINSEKAFQENLINENRKKSAKQKSQFFDLVNSNQKEGLFEMINKGKISKNIDLSSAFFGQGLNSMTLQKPIKFADAKEKFIKRTVNSGSLGQDLQTYKLEPVESSLPQINQNQKAQSLFNKTSEKKLKTVNVQSNSLGLNVNSQFMLEGTGQQKSKEILDSTPNEELNLVSLDPKTYPEVLDQYSLHHFIIRKGRTLEETPEFQSYKRTYIKEWIFIITIIRSLEKLMKDYDISIATVDGKALAQFATLKKQPDIADLILCCVNKEEILKVIKVPKLLYKGPDGLNKAAIRIQSVWKGYICLKQYERLKVMIEKVKLIQRYIRLFQNKKRTQNIIRNKGQDDIDYVKVLQMKLMQDWPVLKLKSRVEIHINTFSYDELKRLSMEKVSQRQNMQITRIFALKDPNLELIYISPYELPSEVVNYYYKILELGDISDYRSRLHFISPEKAYDFPSHYSTSRLLLYSPKALKRIKNLIKGKQAYIVPGYPSNDDIKLAKSIDVPLMSGDPQQHMICSTKSGAKRIFNQCEIPTAPGAYEIYEEKEFINTLAILILNNIRVDTWLFKIDDEVGSRGIAYLNVDSIAFLKKLRKQTIQIEIGQELLIQLQQILADKLPTKVKMAVPSLFQYGYKEYLNQFILKGGIIEACPTCTFSQVSSPSIFFHIDPLGEIKVLGSYDRINGSLYRVIGCSGPQQSLPNMNLEMISSTVGKTLYSRNIFGYVSIDLISFPDPQNPNSHPLFWAVGLDCFLNNYAASCFYFYFLVKGHSDPINGQCILEPSQANQQASSQINSIVSMVSQNQTNLSIEMQQKSKTQSNLRPSQSSQILPNFINETRSFVYFPYVQHSGLEQLQYKTFFHLCRIESVSFDLEKRMGSTFILLDSLQSSLVGIMAVAENQLLGLKYLNDTLKFLQKHLGNINDKFNGFNKEGRTDKIYFSDLISRLKLILRKYDQVINYVPKQRNSSYKNSIYL